MRPYGEQQYGLFTLVLNKFKENAKVISRAARPNILELTRQLMSLEARFKRVCGEQFKRLAHISLGIRVPFDIAPQRAQKARCVN
jgi:hypothetical protein